MASVDNNNIILIVDDDPLFRKMLIKMLEKLDPCVKSPKKNIHTALQKTFANIMPYDSEQWRASARAEPRDALDNNTRDGKTE